MSCFFHTCYVSGFIPLLANPARRRSSRRLIPLAEQSVVSSLLEHLPVSPIVLLAIGSLNRLVPCPHVLEELLVGGLVRVEFGELVALPVRRDVKGRHCFLAAHYERTPDDGVVGRAIDAGGAEEVLA